MKSVIKGALVALCTLAAMCAMAQDVHFIVTRHVVRAVHYVDGVDPCAFQANRIKTRFGEMVNMIIDLYPDAAGRQDAMNRAEDWRDAQLCRIYPEDALADVENPVVIETIDHSQPFVVVDFDFFRFRSTSRYYGEYRHERSFQERGPSPRRHTDRSRQQEEVHLWQQGSRSIQSVPVTGDNNRRDRSSQTTSSYNRRERSAQTARSTSTTTTPSRATTGTHQWQRQGNHESRRTHP